ncbi:hypothetical protein HC761_00060 [bacterium]|nr:hypothetical protein [bacterium]
MERQSQCTGLIVFAPNATAIRLLDRVRFKRAITPMGNSFIEGICPHWFRMLLDAEGIMMTPTLYDQIQIGEAEMLRVLNKA